MRVDRLEVKNFRSFPSLEYVPGEGVNIICGENGLGKTNLIESIWLLTGFRSFRSLKDREAVRLGEASAEVRADVFSSGRKMDVRLLIEDKRRFFLNDESLPSGRSMMGVFNCVVFTPLHLSIIKGGPEERRRFIDVAISRLKPGYSRNLLEYNRILAQRNSALKAAAEKPSAAYMLDLWDEQLSKKGAAVIDARLRFMELIAEPSRNIYAEISSGKEDLLLRYKEYGRRHAAGREDIKESLAEALAKKRQTDIERGSTSVGPHREEFSIKLNGISARSYGSQGQQRSCALALKLAEARVTADITGEEPVVLLDDVFSELDPNRQRYVVRHFEGRQVFITCCDKASLEYIDTPSVTTFDIK